jgi:hypothetical protein
MLICEDKLVIEQLMEFWRGINQSPLEKCMCHEQVNILIVGYGSVMQKEKSGGNHGRTGY